MNQYKVMILSHCSVKSQHYLLKLFKVLVSTDMLVQIVPIVVRCSRGNKVSVGGMEDPRVIGTKLISVIESIVVYRGPGD